MIIITSEEDQLGTLQLTGHISSLPPHDLKDFLDSITIGKFQVFIVDLTRVRSISTSGIGLIYAIKNKLDDLDIPVAFLGNKEEVLRLNPDFTVDKSIPLCENKGKALLTLRKMLFQRKLREKNV